MNDCRIVFLLEHPVGMFERRGIVTVQNS